MFKKITDALPMSNGTQIPVLGFGTWQVPEGEVVERCVREALEIGYRHIDTAAIYGNERGVGNAIRESGIPREQIFVTTKLWNDDQRAGTDAVRRAFDQSMQKLGLEYVDLYLIHWPVKERYKETWRVLEELYGNGKGRERAIGVSNFLPHHLKDLLTTAKVRPMCNQVEFHPWLLQRDLLEFCRELGIVQVAWSPLMQGKIFNFPELVAIAQKHHKSVAQVVLRWDLQHQVVTIPRSVKRERIAENAAIFDFELSEDDMLVIDRLDQGKRIGSSPDNFEF
ncbi:MAG TPA: aldo/keto reductase [Tepidisphaeraceae bacterium]|jgi:diketogulonate reductase-like aldo/keto reductase